MTDSKKTGAFGFLENFAASLRSSHLVALMFGLFVLDLVIPDPILFIDEIVLGVVTILIARWKSRPKKTVPNEAAQSSSTKPPPKNVTPEPEVGR